MNMTIKHLNIFSWVCILYLDLLNINFKINIKYKDFTEYIIIVYIKY